jgi:hypothetical protein
MGKNTGNFNETQPFAAPEFSNSADAIEISDPIPCVLEQGVLLERRQFRFLTTHVFKSALLWTQDSAKCGLYSSPDMSPPVTVSGSTGWREIERKSCKVKIVDSCANIL